MIIFIFFYAFIACHLFYLFFLLPFYFYFFYFRMTYLIWDKAVLHFILSQLIISLSHSFIYSDTRISTYYYHKYFVTRIHNAIFFSFTYIYHAFLNSFHTLNSFWIKYFDNTETRSRICCFHSNLKNVQFGNSML